MLNSANNMKGNILVDYIMRIIINYGSFTFFIVPVPSPPFGNTFSSHVLLDFKKTKFDGLCSRFGIALSNSI